MRRSRPILERNRREVREERQSEQTGHTLGRAWPRQLPGEPKSPQQKDGYLDRQYLHGYQCDDAPYRDGLLNI
ncbi:hypothetical protein NDU88_001150 [Pleurodeles waltl]|uniref:Uncharacterized protein n=1 Tax=Pleurodeles waltl TaxID=8319 RepID=A0AAV7THG8_PLEWA|nr:hypothetical protein NDU88_001150 [Pleurodeles waltl]